MYDNHPFTPSPQQVEFFRWVHTGSGSAILIAVAGSGKTTSILEALTYVPEESHVQLLAFNRAIADELKVKLTKLGERLGRPFAHVRAGTSHSVAFGAVAKFLRGVAVKVDGKKMRRLARELLGDTEYEMYGDFSTKLVDLAKGEGVGVLVPDSLERWHAIIEHHDLFLDSMDATVERAVEIARLLLQRSNEVAKTGDIDFNDQLYLVLLWKLRLWQNDFVIIDEAQDTNPVRRALARLALKPRGRLIAVGDPRQAIYGFTGASHDALDLLRRDFNACELKLTVSYRCATSIAEHVRELVPYFQPSATAPEGKVESLLLRDAVKVLGNHDAILCRNTQPLVTLAYSLIAAKRPCHILGREIGQGLVSLVQKQGKRLTIDRLLEKLDMFEAREVAGFIAKGQEQKAEAVTDRVACIRTVIQHLPETKRTVPDLVVAIDAMFSDTNGQLTLCTIHKAKGREWQRVAILRADLMPSKWARQEHQQQEERNLQYVARSRAMEHLMYLADDKLAA